MNIYFYPISQISPGAFLTPDSTEVIATDSGPVETGLLVRARSIGHAIDLFELCFIALEPKIGKESFNRNNVIKIMTW